MADHIVLLKDDDLVVSALAEKRFHHRPVGIQVQPVIYILYVMSVVQRNYRT